MERRSLTVPQELRITFAIASKFFNGCHNGPPSLQRSNEALKRQKVNATQRPIYPNGCLLSNGQLQLLRLEFMNI